jgi:hypothetical protein
MLVALLVYLTAHAGVLTAPPVIINTIAIGAVVDNIDLNGSLEGKVSNGSANNLVDK